MRSLQNMATEAEQEQKVIEVLEGFEQDRNKTRDRVIESKGGKKKLTKATMELHPEKGLLAHMKEHKYPMKGSLGYKRVNAAGAIKRMVLMGLRFAYKKYIRKHRVDVNKLSPFLREIHRLCNIAILRERDEQMKEKWLIMRDTMTLLLEDHAYAFRLQDILAEADIKKLLPDDNDKYFMGQHWHSKHYNYGGKVPQDEWDKRSEVKKQENA